MTAAPTLVAAEIREAIVAGAADPRTDNFEEMVRPARDFGGSVGQPHLYHLDAYNALRRVAQTPGAPLCGNRLWTQGDSVFAERGASNPEPIAILSNGAGFIFPFHGGRKLVAQDALTWDAFVFERSPSGNWTQTGEWDGDDTELAGSGPAVFGLTHDRDSLAFMAGDRLKLGTYFQQPNARQFAAFPALPISQSGTTRCIREEKQGEDWVCVDQGFEGTTEETSWNGNAHPVGERSIFLKAHSRRTVSTIDAAAVDCSTGGAPTEGSFCRRWSGSSTQTHLRSEIWRVDRVSEVAVKATELAADLEGRYVVSVTGSEDGGRLAVATEVYTQDPGGSVMGTDCRTDFYSYGTDGQLHKDATRAYAATCQPFDWQGGFGAARQMLSATRSPSTRGFSLRARLLRVTGR